MLTKYNILCDYDNGIGNKKKIQPATSHDGALRMFSAVCKHFRSTNEWIFCLCQIT